MGGSWAPSSPGVQLEAPDRDRTVVLRLSRPDVLNALTVDMLVDLAAGMRWFGTAERAAGIVLVGEGRAFSSGDDLHATEDMNRETFRTLIEAFQDVTRAIYRTEVPVVAALNGIAVGGAAEIACACDLRVGCPSSEFLFPENTLGLTISNGSTLILPSLLGRKAIGLVLMGERITAERALDLGLLNAMVKDCGQVETEARRVTASLGEEGRATRLHLAMLRLPIEQVEQALKREVDAALDAWDRGWPQQGIERFFQGRRALQGEKARS
jgi:enoyl-CoA hydratase/carnithine racemase